jgi:GNAT superfamily N-acetyltransferase
MITEIYNDAVLHSTASWDLEPVSLQDRLDWFGMKMAEQWPVLVAEENGEVAGWGSFGPFRDRPGYRHTVEHSVYVRKDELRRGLGSTLISALVSEAQRRGFMRCSAGCRLTIPPVSPFTSGTASLPSPVCQRLDGSSTAGLILCSCSVCWTKTSTIRTRTRTDGNRRTPARHAAEHNVRR